MAHSKKEGLPEIKKTRNVLFFCSWQLKPVHHGLIIEKLKEVTESNDVGHIVFITCSTGLMPCYSNPEGKKSLCNLCMAHTKVALKPYQKRIRHIEIDQLASSTKPKYDYCSVSDIKKIEYRGVKIGYGAMSSYISKTRNVEPEINKEFCNYVNTQLGYQIYLTDLVMDIANEYEINEAYFFNGRTSDTRPVYDVCKNQQIPFTSLEMVKISGQEYRVVEFDNCLPHDLDFRYEIMNTLWTNADPSEAWKVGEQFFAKRRGGKIARDRKVYVKDQITGVLPEGFDQSKKNIVIYNSSQDEFASLGDFIESKSLFTRHEDGIKALFEEFSGEPDYHFYLRLHPNLKNVKYSYHKRLLQLDSAYRNVTVIKADSNVSSYSLLDEADQVITFGSTVGVEACYWGKPVIQLAASLYYFLNVTYKPQTKRELFELIRTDLNPLSQEDAVKFGYYMMNYQAYTRKNTYNPKTVKFLGFYIARVHPYLRLFGSKILFAILDRIYRVYSSFKKDSQYIIPYAEREANSDIDNHIQNHKERE